MMNAVNAHCLLTLIVHPFSVDISVERVFCTAHTKFWLLLLLLLLLHSKRKNQTAGWFGTHLSNSLTEFLFLDVTIPNHVLTDSHGVDSAVAVARKICADAKTTIATRLGRMFACQRSNVTLVTKKIFLNSPSGCWY